MSVLWMDSSAIVIGVIAWGLLLGLLTTLLNVGIWKRTLREGKEERFFEEWRLRLRLRSGQNFTVKSVAAPDRKKIVFYGKKHFILVWKNQDQVLSSEYDQQVGSSRLAEDFNDGTFATLSATEILFVSRGPFQVTITPSEGQVLVRCAAYAFFALWFLALLLLMANFLVVLTG